MSAIGDYVHLTYKGYKEEGSPLLANAAAAIRNKRKELVTRVLQLKQVNQIKDIQNTINQNFQKIQNNTTDDSTIENDIFKWIGNYLLKKYWEDPMSKNLDTKRLQFLSFSKNLGVKNTGRQFQAAKIKNASTEYLIKAIKEIRMGFSKLQSSNGFQNPQDAKKQLDAVIEIIKQVLGDTQTLFKAGDNWAGLQAVDLEDMKIALDKVSKKNKQSLKKALQDFIDAFLKIPPVNLTKGDFAEDIMPFLLNKIDVTALKEGDNILEELQKKETLDRFGIQITGKETNPVAYNEQFFYGGLSSQWKDNDSGSQVKTDVIFTWEGFDKNNPIRASIKNVDLSEDRYWIHTMSDSALSYLLQDENENNFVNHYLNLNVRRSGRVSNILKAQRDECGTVLKLLLLYKGLTGDTYQKKSENKDIADIFIVNARDDKSVASTFKVISMRNLMGRIMNRVITNGGSFQGIGTIKINGKSENFNELYNQTPVEVPKKNKNLNKAMSQYIKQTSEEKFRNYLPRINGILNQMHQRKVSTLIHRDLLEIDRSIPK